MFQYFRKPPGEIPISGQELASFQEGAVGGAVVRSAEIAQRVLELVIQGKELTPEQALAIAQAAQYARQNGVILKIIHAQ